MNNYRLKNNFLIGIAGEHQVGKDTVAEYLRVLFSNDLYCADIYPLGEPLKRDIAELTGGSIKAIEQNKNDSRLRWLLEKYGMEYPHEKDLVSRMEEDLKIFKDTVILVPGVRTIQQADYIREHNGLVIRIRRVYNVGDSRIVKYRTEDYPSERELNKINYDFPILNDATLLRLENYTKDFYFNFLLKHSKWIENLIPQ